jgi:hypothetical protein
VCVSVGIDFCISNAIAMEKCVNAPFFRLVIQLLNICSPAVKELMYAQRKKCIWLIDKPYVHCFLHFLVTGKLVVSQSVLENPRGASLKEFGQGYVEGIPMPQSDV